MPAGAWIEMGAAGLLAAATLAVLMLSVRWQLPGSWLALLAGLPLVVLLLDTEFRIYSFHGFVHTSVVYRLMAGELPPSDPLLAGEPLRYAWALHALIAGAASLLRLTPPTCFAIFNVITGVTTSVLVYRIATRITSDRRAAVFSVLLAVFGLSLFAHGPGSWLLEWLSGVPPEGRLVPIQKFTNVQTNQAGILCFCLGLLALVAQAAHGASLRVSSLVGLFLATLAAALLYPLAWAPLVAVSAASVGLLWLQGRLAWRTTFCLGAAVVLASALASPYLVLVGAGRDPQAGLSPVLAPAHLARNLVQLVLALGAAGVLTLVFRPRPGDAFEASAPRLVLWVTVAMGTFLFLVFHLPWHSEYKFLALAGVGLGVLAGPGLGSLCERSRFGYVLAWALLLPIAAFVTQEIRALRGEPGSVLEQGANLVLSDPREAGLQRWIQDHTRDSAVFVDTRLTIPVFGRRSLYVALDHSGSHDERIRAHAGWGLHPTRILELLIGHPSATVASRQAIAQSLLSPEATPVSQATLVTLRSPLPGAELFVVTRQSAASRKFAGDPRWELAFQEGRLRVWKLAS
jgi:hypothetical protein